MKKCLTALLLFACVVGAQAMAQTPQPKEWSEPEFQNELSKAEIVKFTGTVLSHDPVCHCLVIKTAEGELTLQDDYAKFMQKYDRARGLIVGAEVSGSYKTVKHIHYLMNIAYVQEPSTASVP